MARIIAKVLTATKIYFDNAYSNPSSFSASVVSNTAYDATSWNGVTTIAPSKDAVRDKIESLDSGKADLAGAIFTGPLGSSFELLVNTIDTTWSQEYYVEIDASAEMAGLVLGEGQSGFEVRVKCINIDNGASIQSGATIDGVDGYTFTSAGECLYLKWSVNSNEWKIISKYTP